MFYIKLPSSYLIYSKILAAYDNPTTKPTEVKPCVHVSKYIQQLVFLLFKFPLLLLIITYMCINVLQCTYIKIISITGSDLQLLYGLCVVLE